jgi:putative DNA primase/helicase
MNRINLISPDVNGIPHAPAGLAESAPPSAEACLPILRDAGISLFTDQYGLEWARVPVRGHYETHRVRSKGFRSFLVRYHLSRGEVPSEPALRKTIALLEAVADNDHRELLNRSRWNDDRAALWVDLADKQWRALYVTADGWKVVDQAPSLFRRFTHQKPLPEPVPGGDLWELCQYLPPFASDGDRLLVTAWLISAVLPMPRPILTLVGPHGSGKSTLSGLLRRLVDPSRVELLGRDVRADLPLVFFRHALPVFDNMDAMTPGEADLFCQAVTGRGIARRKLYSDAEEIILSFQRPIIVNSLRLPTNRPDFLDRALIIPLERLPADSRRVLEQIEARFEAARPRLLGALLTALGQALAVLPTIGHERLSRMADFHRFARAVAQALGRSPTDFDEAYRAAEARQKRGAFDNTLALTLFLHARQVTRCQGDATALLQQLRETARAHQIRQSPDFWPDTPMGLGHHLRHLGEALARYGVLISRLPRGNSRLIRIEFDPAAEDPCAVD